MPQLMAGGPSHVTIEGGTHVIMAPVWEFFENSLVPVLNDMDAGISVRLERHGFYPNGGGRVHVKLIRSQTCGGYHCASVQK